MEVAPVLRVDRLHPRCSRVRSLSTLAPRARAVAVDTFDRPAGVPDRAAARVGAPRGWTMSRLCDGPRRCPNRVQPRSGSANTLADDALVPQVVRTPIGARSRFAHRMGMEVIRCPDARLRRTGDLPFRAQPGAVPCRSHDLLSGGLLVLCIRDRIRVIGRVRAAWDDRAATASISRAAVSREVTPRV